MYLQQFVYSLFLIYLFLIYLFTHLSFSLYLYLRTCMTCTYSEAYRNGTLTTEGVKRVLRLDPYKMGKIADFFVREISEAVPRTPIVIQEKEKIPGLGPGSGTSGVGGGVGVSGVASMITTTTATTTTTTSSKSSGGNKNSKNKNRGGNSKSRQGSKRKVSDDGQTDIDVEEIVENEEESGSNDVVVTVDTD